MQFASTLLWLTAAAAIAQCAVLERNYGCVTNAEAQNIVDVFTQLQMLAGNQSVIYNSLLASVVNEDYALESDSIDFLTHQPYGSYTFTNFTGAEADHLQNPAGAYQQNTLNIWHSCKQVIWRWSQVLYPGATPIQGIQVFELGSNNKVDTLFIEFNNALWAEEIGYNITPPAGGSFGSK